MVQGEDAPIVQKRSYWGECALWGWLIRAPAAGQDEARHASEAARLPTRRLAPLHPFPGQQRAHGRLYAYKQHNRLLWPARLALGGLTRLGLLFPATHSPYREWLLELSTSLACSAVHKCLVHAVGR